MPNTLSLEKLQNHLKQKGLTNLRTEFIEHFSTTCYHTVEPIQKEIIIIDLIKYIDQLYFDGEILSAVTKGGLTWQIQTVSERESPEYGWLLTDNLYTTYVNLKLLKTRFDTTTSLALFTSGIEQIQYERVSGFLTILEKSIGDFLEHYPDLLTTAADYSGSIADALFNNIDLLCS